MRKVISVIVFLIFFYQISCSDEVINNETGVISVLVVENDSSESPIPDIEITLTPINEVMFTDTTGTCNFNVRPGSYYVDAEVCCAGAGNIIFHELVKVAENKTSNVKLVGCLSCD